MDEANTRNSWQVALNEKWATYKEMAYDKDLPGGARDWFYDREIMPLLKDKFRESERAKVNKVYDALIVSVGTSYAPLVLSYTAIGPAMVYFVHTQETGAHVDKVVDHLSLKPSQYQRHVVDRADMNQIYETVSGIYRELAGSGADRRSPSVAADFTGGTKAMAGALSLVAAMIGADLFYIGSEWDGAASKPVPGSEFLDRLENPLAAFGEIDRVQASRLWQQGEYTAAADLLEGVNARVPERQQWVVLARLARAYEAWSVLQLRAAAEHLRFVLSTGVDTLRRMRVQGWSEAESDILRRQREVAETLAPHVGGSVIDLSVLQDKKMMGHLIFLLHAIGMRYAAQQKWGLAALHMYRTVEMTLQHRMALYGVRTDEPDYQAFMLNIPVSAQGESKEEKSPGETTAEPTDAAAKYPSEEWLCAMVNKRLSEWKVKSAWESLPRQLALADTHALLCVARDPLVTKTQASANGESVFFVPSGKTVRDSLQARNYHYLIHGYLAVGKDEFTKMQKLADEFVNRLRELYGVPEDQTKVYTPITPII